MLDTEFLHLVNKYGAELAEKDANMYLRDACQCCWYLDDCEDKFAELEARIEDWVYRAFPKMPVGKRAQLEYVLTQCLAFEIGLISKPDEHDVSYPGVGVIAESVGPRPAWKPFKAPDYVDIDFKDIVTFTTKDNTEIDTMYNVPIRVYHDPDEPFEWDDSEITFELEADQEKYREETLDKIISLLEKDAETYDSVNEMAVKEFAGLEDNHESAFEQALEAWEEQSKLEDME